MTFEFLNPTPEPVVLGYGGWSVGGGGGRVTRQAPNLLVLGERDDVGACLLRP
jgi:hypothetical protein